MSKKSLVLFLVTLLLCVCAMGSFAYADELKAAFITPQALGDGSVTDLAYSGFTRAADEFGIKTQVVEVQVGEYEETMRMMASEGYGLLVCLQPDLTDAVRTVAPEYPDTLFFSMLGEIDDIPNVLGSCNREQEGSYLAGVTAALMSKTGRIGHQGQSWTWHRITVMRQDMKMAQRLFVPIFRWILCMPARLKIRLRARSLR